MHSIVSSILISKLGSFTDLILLGWKANVIIMENSHINVDNDSVQHTETMINTLCGSCPYMIKPTHGTMRYKQYTYQYINHLASHV